MENGLPFQSPLGELALVGHDLGIGVSTDKVVRDQPVLDVRVAQVLHTTQQRRHACLLEGVEIAEHCPERS